MTVGAITGATVVAGVVGAPVNHSLSPLIHSAWLTDLGIDGVYVPFPVQEHRFEAFMNGLRGGAVAGLNVTLPFKERALELADRATADARIAGAANLLLFDGDGGIEARNTDGVGLLAAFGEQASDWRPALGPVVVLGAGGAARGAVAALLGAGARVRVVNRSAARAYALTDDFPEVEPFGLERLGSALGDASALINAAPLDERSTAAVAACLDVLPRAAAVMDMVYNPLETRLLKAARDRGLTTVDGLAMLIGQARPSFEAMFGAPPRTVVDVRRLAEIALKDRL